MTNPTGRIFEEMSKIMTDAAGAAQGVRKEGEAMVRGQMAKLMQEMDIVTREQFDVVADMAQAARLENEALKTELEALKDQVAALQAKA